MLIDRTDTALPIDPVAVVPGQAKPEQPADVSFFDALGPAFRQSNVIGSVVNSSHFQPEDQTFDPNYKPFEDIRGTKYEAYHDAFADVPNQKAALSLKAQIDRQNDDNKTLDTAGWGGTAANVLASLADPLNLVPIGGVAFDASKGVIAIGRTALKTGAQFGALTAGQEAVLHGTQVDRPLAQSALNIGGSVIIGGVLGGATGAFLNAAQHAALSKSLERELLSSAPVAADLKQQEGQKVLDSLAGLSAQSVEKPTLDDLSIAGKMASAVHATTQKLNPLLRLYGSFSSVARETAGKLMEVPLYLKMNAAGRASEQGVETLVKEYAGAATDAQLKTRELFRTSRDNGFSGTYAEFRDRVGMAMRRNDIDAGGQGEITSAAQYWRQKVFDPLKDQAIEMKRLPEDVSPETAVSYFSRRYNVPKMEAQEPRFLGMVKSWLDGQLIDIEGQKGAQFVSKADRQNYIEDISKGIFNKITGRDTVGNLPHTIVATDRGPLKERTFSIPDLYQAPDGTRFEDFLHHDVNEVGQRYARIMGAEVELSRKFGGDPTLEKDVIPQITDSYSQLRDQINAREDMAQAAKEKATKQIVADEKSALRDLRAVRDLIRGTYKVGENSTNVARFLSAANAFNYIRQMGGMTLSSLTDAARPMMIHGLLPWFRDGIGPLVTNLKGFKMQVREARLAGNLMERYQHGRLAGWAELTDPYSTRSPAERMLQNMAVGFSKATLIGEWTDFGKAVGAGMTQARILRGVGRYVSVGAKEKRYLAFLGIDEEMANRIAGEFANHGHMEGDIPIAGTEQWQDRIAQQAYRAAINKDVDSIIVTRGVGDVPLFSHTPTGRAILQFKSFNLAAHQRAFMRGLQEGHAGVMSGLLSSVGIGMFQYWLKMVEANLTDKISDNPGTWVAEGLDRSGLLSVLFEVNNIAEKISIPGVYDLAGRAGQQIKPDAHLRTSASRYASRNVTSSLVGPTFGLIENAISLISAGVRRTKGEPFVKSDVTNAFNLLPFRTLPVIRSILDYYVKPGLQDSMDKS